jgi:peptidyl-prolyl cis-trans isomerase SurA
MQALNRAMVVQILFCGGVCLVASAASAELIEHVVAIVNEEIICQTDVAKLKTKLEKGGLVDDSLMRLTDSQSLIKSRENLIQYMVDEKILDSEVKKKNLSATIEQVEQEIRNITTQKNITRAQLKEALQQNGVSFAEYQDFIRTSLERHSLIEKEVRSKIKVSDEDVAAELAAKKGSVGATYEVTLEQMLFRPQRGGTEAAKVRAERALKRIKANEMPFEKLVERYSEDPKAGDDGLLGTFLPNEMPPEMRHGVEKLNLGEVSEIVRTKAGFHIFKVVGKKLVADPAIEKQKEQIFGTLMADAFKRQFRIWLDEKRRDAFIKVNQS